MPKKRVPICTSSPYHVTARCINREWFCLPMETVWSIMEDYLCLISTHYSVRIHSFVLMNNHFHLLISAPLGNLSPAMAYFLRETSKEITRLSKRINQTYGSRHHKSLLVTFHYYMNTYKSVYQNPVRASICERVETYRYSTLSGLLGQSRQCVPLAEDTLLFAPCFNRETLNWLNRTPSPDHTEEVRKALKRTEFKLSTSRKTGKTSILEQDLL